MTLQNIVPVIGLNEVSGSGLLITNSLIRTAKNVKIYRSQCEHLSRQCLDLISALHDHSSELGSSGAQQAVDEVERVLTRILNRVRKWEEMGKMRSFVKQTEIRLGLDESHQELRACSMRFNIALHLDASNRSRELEQTRKHDHDELIEIITRALHDNSVTEQESKDLEARGAEKETLVFSKGPSPGNVELAPVRPKVSADAKENAKPPPKKASSAKKSTETTKAAPAKNATTTKAKKPADKSATTKKPAAAKKASTTKKAATAKEPSTKKTTSAKSDAKKTAAKAAAEAKVKTQSATQPANTASAKPASKGAAKPSSKKSAMA